MISAQSLQKLVPLAQPIYQIVVDGQDITTTVQGRLMDMTLIDNRGFEADQLDLRLDDSDGKLDIPSRSASIRVFIGWQGKGLVDKGTYTVDEVEHSGAPDVMTIRARSADMRTGLTTQRERSWHDVPLGDIINTLADENDLDPMIQATLAGQWIEHLDQTNESAANLLTRLAKQFDAISTVKNGKLIFIPASGGVSASGLALPMVYITRESGDRHRFSIADRESYTGVKATYNDVNKAVKGEVTWGKDENAIEIKKPLKADDAPASGQYKEVGKTYRSRATALKEAQKAWKALKGNKAAKGAYVGVKTKYDDKNLKTSGTVSYGQGEDDKNLKNARRQEEKDREKNDGPAIPRAIAGSAENVKVLRHVYASKLNALRGARAEWRKIQRGVANFSITLERGRPELFPDIPATVSGWKHSIDNTDWIISKVTHTLNESGLTTVLDFEIKATEISDTLTENIE